MSTKCNNKVYIIRLLIKRVKMCTENVLLEVQNGFTDLRGFEGQVLKTKSVHLTFMNLNKTYNKINCDAL